MTSGLKDDLIQLKTRLDTIENQLSGQMKEIENREKKWKSMEEKAERIYSYQNKIFYFKVGGKKFGISHNTLKENTDTLFFQMIDSGRVDLNNEIFFDRSPKMFPLIMEYLRTKEISYKNISKADLQILKEDADYYNVTEISNYLEERLKEISFIRYEYSGPYLFKGETAGNGILSDLSDKSCLKGICANRPGWIIIELNSDWEFDSLDIGGWKGNSTLWYADNGAGATIMTSLNKEEWKNVGTIPVGFGTKVVTAKLTKSVAKFIKFNHVEYLGLGYLNIKKIENF